MSRYILKIALLTKAFLLLLALSGPASAQSIRIGNDDQQVLQVLRSNGYTNGKVTSRSLTIVRTEACKGPDKFLVKISILGRITSQIKIGSCAVARPDVRFGPQQATVLLRKEGYSQIQAEQEGRQVVAIACRRARRYQLILNQSGRIIDRQGIGRCRPQGLNKEQLVGLLQREGYQRIVITDDQLPRYVAEACRNRERVRLDLNSRGVIRSERKIGECGRQFNPANIASMLEKRGYDGVDIVDRRRPPYIAHACKGPNKVEVSIGRFGRIQEELRIGSCRVPLDPAKLSSFLRDKGYDRVRVLRRNRAPYIAEACKQSSLVEVTVGRFGRIRSEDRVGRCAPPVSKASLTEKLREQGYINVNVSRRDGGWNADVCRGLTRQTLRMDAFGDIESERRTGECVSESVLDVITTLERRGAESPNIFVEGCYRGTKYRWSFDRLGNRTGRAPIGTCK